MGLFSNILEKVRRLFGKTAYEKAGLASTFITDEMSAAIDRWAQLYAGKAPWLNKNAQSIGLPSAIAKEISQLVTLEMQVKVTDPDMEGQSDDDVNSRSRSAFIKNTFDSILPRIQIQTEYACALGGLVFKPYATDNGIAIDYVQADDFYPVSFNSRGEIRGAIFLEHKRDDNAYYTRMERHDTKDDSYIITNRAFRSYNKNEIGVEVPLTDVPEWADIEKETSIQGIDHPLYAYFKIPQGNVVDRNSQLGVSVFSRAEVSGLLKEADMQWQRFMWEYEGGELAIDASQDAFKMINVKARDGSISQIPVLPEGKERLFRMNNITSAGDSTTDLLKTYAPSLRDSNYGAGLNIILMRIEDACGIARGTFSDVNEQARTATELKASKQRSYATVTSIQRSLEHALDDLAKAVDTLATLYNLADKGRYAISYVWDDSIVVDADAEREKDRADIRDGIMKAWEYRVKWYGETEEQAKKILAEDAPQSDDEIMGFVQRFQEPDPALEE